MTINEQIKILDNKIRSNQAQYDLDRQNAKMSSLSSGELDKYEYLIGEDLGYKPDVVQKTKFEYSPLGQVFNKGLEKDEKQVGLLKRLKNIEGKTDEQLKENKGNQLGMKSIGFDFKKGISPEGHEAYKKTVDKKKLIDYRYLNMKASPKNEYDFRMFRPLKPFFETIYNGDVLILAAEREQVAFDNKLKKIKKYRSRTDVNINYKASTLKNANKFYDGRKMIIDAFKKKLFPLASGTYYEEFKKLKEESSESEDR